jgi:serine/threonine-protein kinase
LALTLGTRLGVYEVIASIGIGGMGEVFRARDTKLNRDVALKVLPDSFASDPDRLARFTREAQTLASLNHPHIAGIYGLEESGGVSALVMELVEGEDLSQKLQGLRTQGIGLPIDEALPIAKQIAEALEAAHEQGIIHRDLKPANVKVRSDGTVKVLDFGLAKAIEAGGAGQAGGAGRDNFSLSPTITTPAMMTGVGMILGTAAYMSPEQAKGRSVDKRSDVWAFGCVLFEMLTARRAFEGEDVTDTIAAVVRGEPDWSALPADVPQQIRLLIKRCLEKDRKARISDVGVVRFLLTETLPAQAPAGAANPESRTPNPVPVWRRALPVAAAAIVAGAIVGVAAWALRPSPPSSPVMRFALTLGESQQFTANNNQSLAVSPDGTKLVYVANIQLYLRSLSDLDARPIPGTQQTGVGTPVFSPDSQSVAFYEGSERAIKKIAVSGGAAVTICPADSPLLGMSWDSSGLVFGQGVKGILRVSANGGQPTVIASVKSNEFAASPQVLPGGDWVLFTLGTSGEGWDKAQIVAQSLKSSERKTLVSGGADARYVPSGHIVYALGGVLFAVPFDLRHLTVTGGPVPVVEGVKRSAPVASGTAHFSISSTGSLAFVPGPVTTSSRGQNDLALIDRTGSAQPLKLPSAAYEYPRLSPDGKRIAVGSDDDKEAVVWIYDVSGATSIRRLTLGGRNRVPVWSADGEHVAFQSDREGDSAIWWQRADGTTAAERLTQPDKDTAHVPESWSPDGKTLLFSVAKGSSYAVAALSFPDKKVTPFGGIQSRVPPAAAFSPDGKWVAYAANATASNNAQNGLFVQPFPATGATYQIARNGIHPTWTPDGKELFYGPAAGQWVGVSVTTRPTFTFGNPVPMPGRSLDRGPAFERSNDVTPDGKRFLGVVAAGQSTASGNAAAPQIQIVLNWFEELRARVPTK